jgi:hypothetical protein
MRRASVEIVREERLQAAPIAAAAAAHQPPDTFRERTAVDGVEHTQVVDGDMEIGVAPHERSPRRPGSRLCGASDLGKLQPLADTPGTKYRFNGIEYHQGGFRERSGWHRFGR